MATTTATTMDPIPSGSSSGSASVRRRPANRRLSIRAVHDHEPSSGNVFKPLSAPMVAAEISSAAPSQGVLVTLRVQVLQYLADIEDYLSSALEAEKLKGEETVEEAKAWASTALDMLDRIRSDVQSHLPDLHLEGPSRLSDALQDGVRSRLDDVCSRISDIDFHIHRPLDYIPTLHDHLQSLQAHLTSLEHTFSESVAKLTPSKAMLELIHNVMSSDVVSEVTEDLKLSEEAIEKVVADVARAVKRSFDGAELLHYSELPELWQNNPFVRRGYRFIPLSHWHRLVTSVFAWHNETLNIHTHLIPFLIWSMNLLPVVPFWTNAFYDTHETDIPIIVYTTFSLLCLLSSSVWHTMAGCASQTGMELCARIDYIGIGWLISASLSTFVYYGFQHHPTACKFFMGVCMVMGLSGTILPFMNWFNERQYRHYRNAFFVFLALASAAPVAYLCFLYRALDVFKFLSALVPSVGVYTLGFVVYVSHFPEAFLNPRCEHHWLDWLGGGSHAIWHVCVVMGISLHRWGMAQLSDGLPLSV